MSLASPWLVCLLRACRTFSRPIACWNSFSESLRSMRPAMTRLSATLREPAVMLEV